jgi:fructose-bisphosphate aldolase class II
LTWWRALRARWLIRFAAPEVIESYKQHPTHVAFADHLFRPAAADRLTSDFRVADRVTGASTLPLSCAPVTEGVTS